VSDENTFVAGVSGRYATALFGLASDNDAVDAVADDMAALGRAITDSSDLQGLIRNPLMGRDEQTKGITAIAQKAGFNSLTQNFLGLIAQNRRLFFASQMIKDFAKLVAVSRGEVSAEVASAAPLTDAQFGLVKDALAEVVGQDVTLRSAVDESLLGGLVIQVGSRMIDNSLRTKIQNLKVAMKEVG
jgi:F-type H+-transporting ATPase subunit delta